MSTAKHSYFVQRLNEMGISPNLNTIKVPVYVGRWKESEIEKEKEREFFTKDENDNIVINYLGPHGHPYTYRKEENKNVKTFTRTRLKFPISHKIEGKEEIQKYHQERGSGQFPFFTPRIIKKFHDATPIETLYIVEGEFKAFLGDVHAGLDFIGIPSIHGFYNGDIEGKLHDDIVEIIKVNQVQKIVYLTDADTLTVRWEPDKDLSKRPATFYSAIKNFRYSLQNLIDNPVFPLKDVFFSSIETKFIKENAKGLDDLLIKYKDRIAEIVDDLRQFQFSNKYFRTFIISDGKLEKVQRWFGLTSETEFYQTYKEFIGNREFLYKGRRYEWNGEDVRYVRHMDTDKFLRIGPDWFKITMVPNKYDEKKPTITKWKLGEIVRDYKKFPDFIDNIPRYDAFTNKPNFNGQYRRVIHNCYNMCDPLNHEPREGDFSKTAKFLKHLFGGVGNLKLTCSIDDRSLNVMECTRIGDPFTVALDYISLLFQHPEQMLPVPVLVSPENRTGKSTFLKWLQAIFGSNATILGNEQFKMKFNAHYITKYIIGIDEGFLDVDKKSEKERLKQLATADTAFLENKGVNIQEFPYYGKLIICSNDADRVMKIEEGESRWFVVRVPQIPQEEVDPDLEKDIKEEIPAFLYWIKNRQIFHPRKDRLWFKPEWFITDQFKKIVETTKNRLEKSLEEFITDIFLMYKVPEVKLPLQYILDELNKRAKYKIDETDLKYYLKEKKNMTALGPTRVKIPIAVKYPEETVSGQFEIEYNERSCRPYMFKADEWLNAEDMNEFKTNFQYETLPTLPF